MNAERFTSDELSEYERKVVTAEERSLEIERRLYGEIRESIAREAGRLRRTAGVIAQLDVLGNFAQSRRRGIMRGPNSPKMRGLRGSRTTK